MGRWLIRLALLAVLAGGVFWYITEPDVMDPNELAGLTGNAERGALVFHAGGCASCHSAPEAEGEAKLVLAGGKAFPSPFGTFHAPNISPHENGIGGWSAEDLVNAMKYGVTPDGAHYYPAFPYASYSRVKVSDIVDLKAFMDALPPDPTENKPHEIGFPFNIRRLLGGWKWLFVDDGPRLAGLEDATLARGSTLSKGWAIAGNATHRATCWAPCVRRFGLAARRTRAGKGNIPNITPAAGGIADWSEADIIEYLTSGFTPEFDVAGGEMTDVVSNMAQLPDSDREAIAKYLKAVVPLE